MTFNVTGAKDFDAHIDDVMVHLLELEAVDARLGDSDIEAVLSQGLLTINVLATDATLDAASALANSAIRSAIHAAGGATPEWEPTATNRGLAPTARYSFIDQVLAKA
jgi:hypothetical protein